MQVFLTWIQWRQLTWIKVLMKKDQDQDFWNVQILHKCTSADTLHTIWKGPKYAKTEKNLFVIELHYHHFLIFCCFVNVGRPACGATHKNNCFISLFAHFSFLSLEDKLRQGEDCMHDFFFFPRCILPRKKVGHTSSAWFVMCMNIFLELGPFSRI